MKRVIISSVIFIILFCLPVSAEGTATEDFIKEQAELSGADSLDDALPDETRRIFEEEGINATENEWISSLDIGEIFKMLWEMVKENMKAPFTCGALILAVILISGALNSAENGISNTTAGFAVTAATAAVITAPLLSVINSAVEVMQGVATFMTAFVPVFAVVVAASGKAATSVSMSALLLGASQGVELIANHFVIPLMCGYLSVSVASGVSPLLSRSSLPEAIKKTSFWVMSLVTTVFIGVLSIQTAVNASADSLGTRTAKFIIGSSVPVAGTVLSEALTTVTASLGMLKTTVAIYGVVACCVIFLPVLINLSLWRLTLNIMAFAADVLSATKTSQLLRSADTAISVLCGIILLTCAMFIISLTVVVSAGKTV